ncbi:hypothetical protein [Nostoc sp. TCL26-01]|uniref:hypothetical protein n=1 Tax=Nostoc sp. TCL26-01 TaxID=2576904 RepID=UPI0015BDA206|nr:hypothetical protein [Nostoc sp. TCL26-01]
MLPDTILIYEITSSRIISLPGIGQDHFLKLGSTFSIKMTSERSRSSVGRES